MARQYGLDQQQQALYDALIKALGPQSKGFGPTSESDLHKAVEETQDNIKELNEHTEKLSDAFKAVIVEAADQEDALKKANISLAKSTKLFGSLDDELAALQNKSIPQARIYLKEYSQTTKNLTTELGKTIRNQSLFGASLLESHTEIQRGTLRYTEMMGNMYDATNGLSEGLLKQANVWDSTTEAIQKNLNPIDFARLHVAIGQAQTAIAENIGGAAGLGKLTQLATMSEEEFAKTISANEESGKALQSAMFATVAQLDRLGQSLEINGPNGKEKVSLTDEHGKINQSAVDALQGDSVKMQLVAKALIDTINKNKQASDSFAVIAKNSSTILGSWSNHIGGVVSKLTSLEGATELVQRGFYALGDSALIKKSFDMMKEGLKDTYKNLIDFNIAQVPASFASVNYASMKLGMSFQDTVKFMQENKRVMALYGAGFDNLTSSLKGTFQKFGYTFQQGAEAVGPAFEAAIATGINVKNGDALNAFVDQTAGQFKKISGILPITLAEYAKMNATLLDSNEVQGTLLGLDQDTAMARSKDLISLRDHYIAEGISADMANELVRAQQAQKNEPVKEQITNAAKEAFAAQYAGLSGAQSQEIQQLAMLGQARTADQNLRLEELRKETQVGLAQRTAAANATGQVGVVLSNQIGTQYAGSTSGESATGQAAARRAAEVQKAGANVTPEQQAAAADKAAGSGAVAGFANIVNSVGSVLKNSLVTATLGAAGGLFGLMTQSLLTARALGKLGGGISDFIPGGKFLDKIKGGIGKIFGGGAAAGEAGAATVAEGAGATAAGGGVAALLALPAAIAAAAAAVGTAGYSAVKAARGEDASNWISNLDAKLPGGGIGGALGKGLDFLTGNDSYDPNKGPVFNAGPRKSGATPGAAKPPPSVGIPGAGQAAGSVNTADAVPGAAPAESANTTTTVQDTTAHDYLSTIADNMVVAVKLLQMISDNGNSAPAEIVAARLKDAGVKKLPNATTYMTGRQTAPA